MDGWMNEINGQMNEQKNGWICGKNNGYMGG